jgi:hypothetical protein
MKSHTVTGGGAQIHLVEAGNRCAKGNTVASCEQCQQQLPGRHCFPGTGDRCGASSCVVECPT